MGILEPYKAPYLNRWFTGPKETDSFVFIQDLQPVNQVIIQKYYIEPMIEMVFGS